MKEIILSAPGKNALGTELMGRVIASLHEAAGQPVLLTGSGDAFSAGLNLNEVLSLDREGMKQFLALLDEMTRVLWEYPGPSVALVNGHAIAGGCVLCLCCDHRVMTDAPKARIGLNEVALGLHFPPKVMKAVSERVPRSHWERVILGADLFDAATALELGLVDEVSSDASRVAGERLAVLSSRPAGAYARTKGILRGSRLAVTTEEALRFERDDLPVWTSSEVREIIRALVRR